MIKVEKIQIEEFRGIRNLILNFNCKNFVVCGPNGTGKSGVVDALEFALTGNISRLTGEGMGNVSVKEHAPHVDSRDNPERARVTLTLQIPSLGNNPVVLTRTVKNPSLPIITPSSPEILGVLERFNGHPEFVLSRREIIRYVISKPGNRSEEVQALLRLDQIGELRSNLKTISNYYEKESKDSKKSQIQVNENLAQAIGITELSKAKILEAVNLRRTILGLPSLEDLTATTALNDGLATSSKTVTSPRVNKFSATADLKLCKETLQKISVDTIRSECIELKNQLTALSSNPMAVESLSREKFLRSAIEFITDSLCPVCDTKWEIQDLQGIVLSKLKKFEAVTKERSDLEFRLGLVIALIDDIDNAITSIEKIAKVLVSEYLTVFSKYHLFLDKNRKALKNFLPFEDTILAIENILTVPSNIADAIGVIEAAVTGIPEPTQQDEARDYLIRAQDRLENYRRVSRDAEKAKDRSVLSKTIYDIYTEVSNKALENIYKEVEGEFSGLYRFINNEDEDRFTAKLTPSIGKLGFDVDFYGRGHFPPGAYHSEGHQDAMGLCLYLALMRKLQGENFSFAVLDDVLMSVDSMHRREVCNLLKQHFPDTQFILTTHDDVWSKTMKTVGLITPGNVAHFSYWSPDLGPAEWKTRDVWVEINDALKVNDVQTAGSKLRYYLEYFFREVCDKLHVKVEFRGDGRYELGDTLTPAVRRFRDLLIQGVKAAEVWKQTNVANDLKTREKGIGEALIATNAEQWEVNSAIHYNEWANFTKNDFTPVVTAYRDLLSKFVCDNQECLGLFYLTSTQPKILESVRCACGKTNINLKKS